MHFGQLVWPIGLQTCGLKARCPNAAAHLKQLGRLGGGQSFTLLGRLDIEVRMIVLLGEPLQVPGVFYVEAESERDEHTRRRRHPNAPAKIVRLAGARLEARGGAIRLVAVGGESAERESGRRLLHGAIFVVA